jgi:DNA-binding IclR family transcriptional regulator
MTAKMGKSKTVSSIVRSVRILQSISSGNSRIGKIAEQLALSKATTHRLLETLITVGFVVQDPLTHRYSLGPDLLKLASDQSLIHEALFGCAIHPMTRLRDTTRETVLLDIRAGLQKVCIEKLDSPESIKYTNAKGFAAPIYVGGGGKILLSQLPDDQIERLIKQIRFAAITPNTIIDKEQLWAEIRKARQQGYATSFGERVVGSSCVSVPVLNYFTPVALSILGPASRFTEKKIMDILPELKRAGGAISRAVRRLGEKITSDD